MPVQKEEEKPEQQQTEGGKYQRFRCAAQPGQTIDERMSHSPPEAVPACPVNFREQISKQGVATDNLQGKGQTGEPRSAAIKQKVKERQQENAPAAAPKYGSSGVDVFDERCICFQ